MIQASAPGKLYIAGEYAVLEPGHPAIIIALNQFVTVKLRKATANGSITSTHSQGLPISWKRKNGVFFIDQRENPFAYVAEAITVTEKYLLEIGKSLTYFDLDIESDLDNKDGRKYGLGSSGAVTVATIKALLTFYQVSYTNEDIYKLAALTHLSINSNGSFGDLAASTFGGWIAYSCFDRNWVIEQSKILSMQTLLKMKWPNLMIEELDPPSDAQLVIGWTGSPSSTTQLVDNLKEEISDITTNYDLFLERSKKCVFDIIQGFKQNNLKMIQQGIRFNRLLLQQLSIDSGMIIETPTLFEMCEIAEEFNGAGKSSGAGGGDCGIVLLHKSINISPMIQEWEKHNITYLDFDVHHILLKKNNQKKENTNVYS